MRISLAERYVRVSAGLAAKQRDPLAWWHFAVPRLKQAFALFTADDPIDELLARGPNKGTKTQTLAAYFLACLQKRPHLDGVPLPQWRGRVEAAQLVQDYKQQLLSVQPAYLKLLGGWPHHARYNGEYLSSIHVQPLNGSSDESTWSVVHFLTEENRRTGVGVRADLVGFDEPPSMDILRELRKAAHAGRRLVIVIGMTPTVRRQWAPVREDYGDTPRRSIRRVDRERAEVRWGLGDVADWVLSPEEKAKLRRSYARDPLREAREEGDYTNTEGSCPFDGETLIRMLDECYEPRILVCRVNREKNEEGEPVVIERVEVEIFEDAVKGCEYYEDIDPASGVDDGRHNPAGMLVSKIGPGDLQVRWNGYLSPYSVGVLGTGIARQYNSAAIDIEMKDHWGVNVLRGVYASRYGNLCQEQRELRPNVWSKEVGFDNNEEVRAIIIGEVQEWIEAWRSGVKYARCPSKKIINTLLDCELDDRGKIVAGPGIAHGEDLILWGQSLRRAARRSSREIPEIQRPFKTPDELLAALIRGEAVDPEDDPPFGQSVMKHRLPPGY